MNLWSKDGSQKKKPLLYGRVNRTTSYHLVPPVTGSVGQNSFINSQSTVLLMSSHMTVVRNYIATFRIEQTPFGTALVHDKNHHTIVNEVAANDPKKLCVNNKDR